MLFTGCSTSTISANEEEIKKEDIDIRELDVYIYEQTLAIGLNNGYRCTNFEQEFNKDTQEYTITITIFKPIKKE